MKASKTGTDTEQPLVAHLIELRDRLLRAILAVALVVVVIFALGLSNDIYTYVSLPLQKFLPEGTSMIATQVASPFLTPFKLSLFVSVLIALPYLLYQIWSFVAPALYKEEKNLVVPLLISSVVLFYLGMTFAYFVVFPIVFGFFTSVAPEGISVMTDIGSYLDFVLKLFFAFGCAFEIPIATVLLIWSGVTDSKSLARKRPYVIVGCFVLGMLLTPPDVISQSLLALPMWLLFEVGIFFGRFVGRSKARDGDSAEDNDSAENNSADLR